MSLEQKIQLVLAQPGSINHRASLAVEMERLNMLDAELVWLAAVKLAASRGDFFNSFTLTRMHLPEDRQQEMLLHLASLFAKDRRPNTPEEREPPFSPPPTLPKNPQELRRLAIKVGTTTAGMGKPWETNFPTLPIFGALNQRAFVALASSLEPVQLRAQQALVQQGEKEQAMYLLSHGSVEVIQHRTGQSDLHLATVPAPSLIGEMSLLTSTPRRATVRTKGAALAWKMSADVLAQLTHQHPELIQQIRRLIEHRQLSNLLRTSQLFQSVSQREQLLHAFHIRSVELDAEIFPQGVSAPGLFIVLHGEAVVFSHTDDGRRVRVADLHEGDTFGEISLLTGNPTSASVWMPEGGLLLHMPPKEYHHWRTQIPSLESELAHLMQVRKRELTDLLIPVQMAHHETDFSWYNTQELDI